MWKGNLLDISIDCLFNDAASGSYNIASINIMGNDRYFANDVDGNVGSVM
jgi:hypothetical protein